MGEVLKHTLRNLCHKSGWCYAVFWKLKRRSRMVLTWEDGHYDAPNGLENGTVYRQQMEHQINLEVVKMSIHVYSLGEGIIGRVAFTGKHQWIYGNQRISENGSSPEKYPDGWSSQFAAGINTIAVVAVPQGVVQLGSIQVMPEDLNLVGQIRSLFGTLQSIPGGLVTDLKNPSPLPTVKAYTTPVTTVTVPNPTFAVPFSGYSKPHDHSTSVPFNTHHQTAYPALDQKAVFQQAATAVRVGYDSIRVPSDLAVKRPRLANQGQLTMDYHGSQNHHQNSQNHGFMGTSEARNTIPGTNSKLFDIPGPDTTFRANHGNHFGTSNSIWSPPSQTSSFTGFDSLPQLGEETATTTTTCLLDSDENYDYNSLFKAKDGLEDFNNVLAALSKDCGVLLPLNEGFRTSNEGVGFRASNEGVATTGSTNFGFGDELSEVLALLQKNDNHHNVTSFSDNLHLQKNGYNKDHNNGVGATSYSDVMFTATSSAGGDVKPVDTNVLTARTFELPSQEIDKLSGYCDILACLNDNKLEPLLDAVVAGASMASPCSKPAKESPKPAPFTGTTLVVPPVATAASSGKELEKTAAPQQASSSSLERVPKWSSSALQMKAAVSSWASEASNKKEHPVKDSSSASKKPEDASARVVGRKRLRPGETPRPRPKDRQQIQDRVRELRDIVPNATKCSIDSLLEKTIKHMQFLQSVTQHGDKWKAGADTKVGGIYEQQQQQLSESGATWAMEVGPKGPSPVSVVENLRQPGQMLVEMLCEEKGLFWEIADKIRGLGLTILKGVMESRNDKVWARFNVEQQPQQQMQASCGVNRCKVLWNLVQLLEPNKHNGGGTSTAAGAAAAGSAAASFTTAAGSEVTDVCSESFSGFQTQTLAAAHRGITVSSNGW